MEITTQELKERIDKGEKILVDFYGTFCGPCKIMKPWFENVSRELETKNSEVKLFTFNIDNDRDFVINEIGIRSVPTLVGYKNGEKIYHNVGVLRQEQIINVINDVLV